MKKLMSVLLALALVLAMVPVAASAAEGDTPTITIEGEGPSKTYSSLSEAVTAAEPGGTILISAGTLEIGSMIIQKPVNIQGAVDDTTTLVGSVIYRFDGESFEAPSYKSISWERITLTPASEGQNPNHQGLCFGIAVTGYELTVDNCSFEGWEYAVTANSTANANNTLSVTNSNFVDTGCAVSVREGTALNDFEGSTADGFAVQYFNGNYNEPNNVNGYYNSFENYTEDKNEGAYEPDIDATDENIKVVFTANELKTAVQNATDGATVYLAAGTYNLTDTLSITKRVNLVGAGTDKTTIVGPVQYKFSEDQKEAALSISGITFKAGQDKIQGLQFCATGPNGGYNLNITVANSAFEGWDFGITMNSHANGYDLTVADCFFANGLYAVSYNNDPTTEGQKANNTLAFSGTNTLEDVTFAVQKFNNAPVGTESVVDYTYATVEDYTAETPTYKGRVKYVTTADELTSAINGATDPTVVYLAKDIELNNVLAIEKANITIEGNGNAIKYTGTVIAGSLVGGAFITMQGDGNNVTLQNVTIDTDKKVKHGVQFYCVKGGKLDNVTVKGGAWTSVQVNGSTDIVITDCTLKPDPKNGNNPYAYIEYAMGSGVTQVPSMSIENVTGQADGDVPLIYADQGTMTRVKENDEGLQEGTDVTNDQILEVINGKIEGADLELGTDDDGDTIIVGDETPSTPGGGTPSEPEEPTWPFTDVTEGDDWFYDAVAYVYENGIMAGTDETTFEPYMELDRAMAAQLFYNLEGKPTVTGDSAFTDVTSGHWAVDAITWAAQNDIVAGIGGGLYDPESNVTREQFAVMLYKYARFKGYDLTAAGDLTRFPDAGSTSSWAETALSWASGKGLINGHEDGTIDPKGSTIRAQAASIMANFDQNVAK